MITLKAMPFDSNEIIDPVTGEVSFDRGAVSRDMADWLRTYISNGVLVRGGNVLGSQLQVAHKEGLTLTVKQGAVCINGRTGWLEADADVAVDMGGAQPRIDRVVAELNIPNDRGVYIKVLAGSPANEPAAPELTQTEDVYQIPLAQIAVAAASATVAEIIDERPDHVSNVTIGIKPPTGMDAETVRISDETRDNYGLSAVDATVDKALRRGLNLSSYMAFCANVNADSLDAAFGKNNEDRVNNLGLQLAMYAWFKGDTIDNHPFSALIKCGSLEDINDNTEATKEILANETLIDLYKSSDYAVMRLYTPKVIEYVKRSKAHMRTLISNGYFIDSVRENAESLAIFNAGRVALLTPGDVAWKVPDDYDKDFIFVQLVAGGGGGGFGSLFPRKCGEYVMGIVDVAAGQTLSGNIGLPGNNSHAGLVLFAGLAATQGKGAVQHGAFLVKASDGVGNGAGQGGFEGGLGGGAGSLEAGCGNMALGPSINTGGSGYASAGRTADSGESGGGGGTSTNAGTCTGGGGYGGGGGASGTNTGAGGGSGAIVICL